LVPLPAHAAPAPPSDGAADASSAEGAAEAGSAEAGSAVAAPLAAPPVVAAAVGAFEAPGVVAQALAMSTALDRSAIHDRCRRITDLLLQQRCRPRHRIDDRRDVSRDRIAARAGKGTP